MLSDLDAPNSINFILFKLFTYLNINSSIFLTFNFLIKKLLISKNFFYIFEFFWAIFFLQINPANIYSLQ